MNEDMKIVRARLNADRVYLGMESVAPKALRAGDVVFWAQRLPRDETGALAVALPDDVVLLDGDCDLPGGRYRWNAKTQHFDPLPPNLGGPLAAGATTERVVYDTARALHQMNADCVTPHMLEWCVGYEKGFDALAFLVELNYFHTMLGLSRGPQAKE
jgi:hypothetical protein